MASTAPASALNAIRAGGRPPDDASAPAGTRSPTETRGSTRAEMVLRDSPVSTESSDLVRPRPSRKIWSRSPVPIPPLRPEARCRSCRRVNHTGEGRGRQPVERLRRLVRGLDERGQREGELEIRSPRVRLRDAVAHWSSASGASGRISSSCQPLSPDVMEPQRSRGRSSGPLLG